MDIRNQDWHGQMTLTGIGTPIESKGSLVAMIGEMLKHLQTVNPRALASGDKEIIIRFKNNPFVDSKSIADINRIANIETGLDDSHILRGPQPTESFESYTQFLIDNGTPDNTAILVASEWFDLPAPENLLSWLRDPQVARFNELNTRDESFAQALPLEYMTLKNYVFTTYPEFAAKIICRTA